jgi:lactoylglutathione lyase
VAAPGLAGSDEPGIGGVSIAAPVRDCLHLKCVRPSASGRARFPHGAATTLSLAHLGLADTLLLVRRQGTQSKEHRTAMKQLRSISPIGDGDTNAVPVKDIDPAIGFYTQVLGFSLVKKDQQSAVLKRDDVQIGLVAKGDHDPRRAGSFYFDIVDVETLRREFQGNGGKPGAIEIQEYQGKNYRLFFLRECDMMASHDGYCFCFGQPA